VHSTPEDIMLDSHRLEDEWLEADGLGGYASGTVGGRRTRRYHALLLAATAPPTGRMVLVNGVETWITTPAGQFPLSTQFYAPSVSYPDGEARIASFTMEPWPTWRFRLADGTEIEQSVCVPNGNAAVTVVWRRLSGAGVSLTVRPLLSGRDYHSLHHENPAFRCDADVDGQQVTWRPYDGVPETICYSNGRYTHAADWYRNFLYTLEQERGLDCIEDLASPGFFEFDLNRDEACWILTAAGPQALELQAGSTAEQLCRDLRNAERRRRAQFASPLARSADAYLARRTGGKTIVAGYPWFTDWGRDTFIALRGLCLATGRLEDARDILLTWAGAVDEGMLPNRFPDSGSVAEFNSVDASLWYVIAVHEFLRFAERASFGVSRLERAALAAAIEAVVTGYARGTRYNIRLDRDGLLACGVGGVQLTWMDAKVGDWVVTPRIGKPVEVQALWLNALHIVGENDPAWRAAFDRGLAAFLTRFVNQEGGCLYDVVDVDHHPGQCDASLRPNQIFAVGGLPLAIMEGPAARRIVDVVEERLLTPQGLRTLAPGSRDYAPRYEGGVRERDGAYHQGTVWPWLLGPFVEAWLRVRGSSTEAKQEARRRFVEPLLEHLDHAGLGHVSEIADGDPPHTPRGCPWQAWSLGELLRLTRSVLADPAVGPSSTAQADSSAAGEVSGHAARNRTAKAS
jgi:predicted glycogen debranching enzyme